MNTTLSTVIPDNLQAALAEPTVIGRPGEPVDIAVAPLDLAAPMNGWISKFFEVDGGHRAISLSFGLHAQ
jgi:hypothetical protein